MRAVKSIKNTFFSAFFQLVALIVNFVVRIFFIRYLGSQYLGLNGLLTNILQVLSLAELGVGEAINYSLYKPLAKNDYKTCCALMYLYKKIYIILGVLITCVGLCFMPFLNFFIKDMTGLHHVYIIFILFVLNTSVSYFYSYSWNLMVADQKKYIVNTYRYTIYSIFKVVQIFYLIYKKDLVGYMVIQVISTFLENFILSIKAKKMYPLLKSKDIPKLNKKTTKEIKKNTKAMMMHKIGNTLVNSTDNIILSKFIGLTVVGIYSNYYMIFNSINVIFGQAYSALTSSIGNFYVDSEENAKYTVFKKINFITFWIYSFCSTVLFVVLNTFIEWWAGKSYVFNIEIVILLILIFYVNGMRKAVLTFREASGLFYKDRWKSIVEAICNLVVSIILGIKLGVIGVFIGTIVSVSLVSVWLEPYILYKYSFNKKLKYYFKTYSKYLVFTVISAFLIYYLCSFVKLSLFISIIVKFLISFIMSNLLIVIFFFKTDEFQYYYYLLKKFFRRAIIWKK